MQKRTVVVKQLPATLSGKQAKLFLRELEASMQAERPYLVLDCSRIGTMDGSVIHLLLCCLEEALKRNGDIKLSAIPSSAVSTLAQTGVDRLFDIFETTDAAVTGFHQPQRAMIAQTPVLDLPASRPAESKSSVLPWSFWQAQSVAGFEEN
jgi:anti-anti-sigma factor